GVVIDTRAGDAFAAGHVPGTLNIPLGKSFSTWCGWLVPYDRDAYLVAAGEGEAAHAAREMAKIGLDRVGGWFAADGLAAWSGGAGALERGAHETAASIA